MGFPAIKLDDALWCDLCEDFRDVDEVLDIGNIRYRIGSWCIECLEREVDKILDKPKEDWTDPDRAVLEAWLTNYIYIRSIK